MTKSNKADFQNQYKQVGKVFSPFFDCYINFNSIGLHYLYNIWSTSQEELELRTRLTLLIPKFLKEKLLRPLLGSEITKTVFGKNIGVFVSYEYRN